VVDGGSQWADNGFSTAAGGSRVSIDHASQNWVLRRHASMVLSVTAFLALASSA
jgi:hypothetical protein